MTTHQFYACVWNVMLMLAGYSLEPLAQWRWIK